MNRSKKKASNKMQDILSFMSGTVARSSRMFETDSEPQSRERRVIGRRSAMLCQKKDEHVQQQAQGPFEPQVSAVQLHRTRQRSSRPWRHELKFDSAQHIWPSRTCRRR